MPESGSLSSPGRDHSALYRRAAVAQIAWLIAAVGVWSVALLGFPLDPDYTAGELLDHVLSWRETGVLYPALDGGAGLRVLNYPPLVLLLARGWTELGVPPLLAGRLVNGCAAVLVIATLTWWARARGARGAALLGTVGLLGASMPFLYATGQFHIELWAVLGTLSGFAILDRGQRRAALFGAGVLLAAGCLAKQTQVVPSVIALIWVWRHRSAALAPVIAGFGLMGVLGVATISVEWGMEAWRHMLQYTTGTYSARTLGWQWASHVAPLAILLGLVGWGGLRGGVGARRDPAWWYWCGALLWSLSAARDGAGYPYFMDLHLATVVLAGPVVFGGAARVAAGRWAAVLPWVFAVQVVGADVGAASVLAVNMGRLKERSTSLETLCARFESSGPVLVEEAGLARACERPTVLHPFIMTSLANRGLWDPASLERRVARGDFSPAVVGFDPGAPVRGAQADRWPPGMVESFRTARSVESIGGGWWLLTW